MLFTWPAGPSEMLIKGHIVSLGRPGPVPELARSSADEPHVSRRVDVSWILYTLRVKTSHFKWCGFQVSLQGRSLIWVSENIQKKQKISTLASNKSLMMLGV